jgi:hypothetical protein
MKETLFAALLVGSALLAAQMLHAGTIRLSGSCNLTNAILAANWDAPVAGCPAGLGEDQIFLKRRQHLRPKQPYPEITSEMVIHGRGGTITRSGVRPFTLFRVFPTGSLDIRHINLVKGFSAIESSGPLTVRNATISDSASNAVYASGPLTVINSTFSNNQVADIGGAAIYVSGNETAPIVITDSTFVDNNSGDDAGGAIRVDDGFLTLARNLFVGNRDLIGYDVQTFDPYQGGYNVFQGERTQYPSLTDVLSDLPRNQIVKKNLTISSAGTLVHGLPRTSPAIDVVTDGTCIVPYDQRFIARPQDGNQDGGPACDAGAIEYVPPAP